MGEHSWKEPEFETCKICGDKDWMQPTVCEVRPENRLSAEAKEALNEMKIMQPYYTLKNFTGIMGELVNAGFVEEIENPVGDWPAYRRKKFKTTSST